MSRDDGRADGFGTDGYRDEVFALFQAIWHFKDWIKYDPNVDEATKRSLEAWVDMRGDMLKVAADVANGSKHMVLMRQRADGSAQTRNDVHVFVGHNVIKTTFYIADHRTSSDHEAVALADLCIDEWRAFLMENGLQWPEP